jgi:hypothetical protein
MDYSSSPFASCEQLESRTFLSGTVLDNAPAALFHEPAISQPLEAPRTERAAPKKGFTGTFRGDGWGYLDDGLEGKKNLKFTLTISKVTVNPYGQAKISGAFTTPVGKVSFKNADGGLQRKELYIIYHNFDYSRSFGGSFFVASRGKGLKGVNVGAMVNGHIMASFNFTLTRR